MNAFRILIGTIFAIAVLAAPWPIGGNWPFTRTCLLVFGLIGLGLAISDRNPRRPMARFPVIWIPLVIGVLFVAFQSSTLSASLCEMAGGPRPYSDSVDTDTATISLYPAATREKLVDLLMAVGIFFAATVLLRDRKTIVPVLIALTFVGAVMSFFGVIQSLSWNGKLYWQYELISGGRPFGPFVNKNNGAGFLVITFSAALFFVAHQLFTWKIKNEPAGLVLAEDHWERESESKRSFFASCLNTFSKLQPKHLYCSAAVAAIFCGIFVSLSRGGMVALLGACTVSIFLFSRASKWMVLILCSLLAVIGIGFVVATGQTDLVTSQIETLTEVDTKSTPRLLHWQDALPFAQEHLATGTGAGTYRYVSNSFQTFFFQRSYAHAESIFIETLVEMGIGGVVLLVLAILAAVIASVKLFRRAEAFDSALGACGLICLCGQTIASTLDFGLYQPANATAMAILMGCVIGRSCTDLTRPNQMKKQTSRNQILIYVFLVGMIAAALWATYESLGIESRKRAGRNIALINEYKTSLGRLTSRTSLNRTEKLLERAIKIRPDDSEAHFQLGELHLARFRTEGATRLNEQLDAQIAADTSDNPPEKPAMDQVWATTAPATIHRQYRFALRSNSPQVQIISEDELIRKHWPLAWAQYQRAEELCPYLSKTQYRLAELSAFFDGNEAEHIEKTLERALLNTKLMFSCGLLSLSSGDQKSAVDLWSKCLANPNSRAYERTIVEICQAELPMRSLFEEVLPQTPKQLIYIANKYFERPDMMLPKRLLLVHTKRVIDKAELSELERNFFSAEACRMSDEFKPAAEFYKKALELDPSQVQWRFNYAKCLHQNKQYDEAIRQLKICELESKSLNSSIKTLLKKIRKDRAERN